MKLQDITTINETENNFKDVSTLNIKLQLTKMNKN